VALRDLLAVFDVRVNDAALVEGEARADSYQATLEAVAAQVQALDSAQIEAPAVAAATVPEAEGGDTPVAVELDVTQAEAEIARLEQAHAGLKAAILSQGPVDLETGPAADALGQITARVDALRAQIADAPPAVAIDVDTSELDAIPAAADAAAAALAGVGAPVRDPLRGAQMPRVLAETTAAAQRTAVALEGIGNADVTNPVQGALARLRGQVTSMWGAMRNPPVIPTTPLTAFGGALGPVTGLLGAFGVALGAQQLVSFGASVVNRAGELTDLSAALRISTRDLQLFDAWLGQSGASAQDLPTAVRAMSAALNPLTEESKAAQAAFKELGISQEEQKELGKDTSAAFLRLGGAIGEIENPTKRATVAQAVLGRSALSLLPAFEGGTDAIQAQLAALEEMGILIDDDTVAAFDELGDKVGLAKLQFQVLTSKAIVALLPYLDATIKGFGSLSGWLQRNVSMAGVFRTAFVGGAMVLSRFVGVLNLGGLTLARVGGWLTRLSGFASVAARWLLRVALPFLFLEDVFGFLQGKESVLGDIADGLFGVGSAGEVLQLVRDLASGVGDAFSLLWDIMTGNPIDATTGQMTAGIAAWMNALSDFEFFFNDVFAHIVGYAVGAFGAVSQTIGDFLGAIPGLGDVGASLSAFGKDQQSNATATLDRQKNSPGLTAGGDQIARPVVPAPSVPGAPPAPGPVINQTNTVNASFTGVAGAPTDIKEAGDRVGKAAGDALARTNTGALRSAGVPR
jgi:hypothetical protein